jgi:anti-sigma B factor antagonist
MMEAISTNVEGDVTVVTVDGNLDSQLPRDLLQTIQTAIGRGEGKFVLDLSGVRIINSMGLGSLVAIFTTIANSGGRIVFSGLNKNLKDSLILTKLISLFEIADSVADATALLKG